MMNGGDAPQARLSTGIHGLDKMLGGGFMAGDSTLVAGSPGTGKTTLGLHFLAAGVAAGQRGLLVTFEYLPQQIYRDAEKKGIPLREWERTDKVKVICTSPAILLSRPKEKATVLDDLIRQVGAQRVVLDSMSHFEFLGRPGHELRETIAGVMNHLRMMSVTSLLTHEIPQIVGPAVTISNYGLEFLVDNILLLRYVELEGELTKAMNVLKFRSGAHDRRYRVLELTDKGVVVQADFAGIENITSGTARRTVSERITKLV